jgi:hypothetical protein
MSSVTLGIKYEVAALKSKPVVSKTCELPAVCSFTSKPPPTQNTHTFFLSIDCSYYVLYITD